ncbi:RING finger protein 32 [Octopus bimaculoides]|nr:RING finger protein 32 [Octopus bimaculoides]|eukprot:XP_014783096.1 PREDICTED: RING finger protein 32-like [Octopus bimaculoides]
MPQNYNAALIAAAIQDHLSLKASGNKTVTRIPSHHSMTRKKNIKAVVDSGLRQSSTKLPKFPFEKVQAEYVLDAAPSLSLAQKLGIVECPAKQLSEFEWKNVKEQSNSRHDSCQPCVICKENFGEESQVLLSCSHVFHKTCLQAFEKFSNRKSCPMCRYQQYETRVIHEGRKQHYYKNATIIQAAWRGYVVRKWYTKLRETTPPSNPILRRRFFEKKLEEIVDKTLKSYDIGVDEFLEEMDQSIAAHRQLFNSFNHCYIGLEEWKKIKSKALQREHLDCPICVTSITIDNGLIPETNSIFDLECRTQDLSGIPYTSNSPKRVAFLLSCSHIFHKTCLETFESFMRDSTPLVCPVCRSLYSKRLLSAI